MRLVLDVPGVDTTKKYTPGETLELVHVRGIGPTYHANVVSRGDVESNVGAVGEAGPIERNPSYGGEYVRRAMVEFRATSSRKLERLELGDNTISVTENYRGERIRNKIVQLFSIKRT